MLSLLGFLILFELLAAKLNIFILLAPKNFLSMDGRFIFKDTAHWLESLAV